MASFELIASSTANQTLNTNETGVIGLGATLSGYIIIGGDGVTIQNAGAILAGTETAIVSSVYTGVSISNTGQIISDSDTIYIGINDTTPLDNKISNFGKIISVSEMAIFMNGQNNTITNGGTIQGGETAIRLYDIGVTGINRLSNSGVIIAADTFFSYSGGQHKDLIENTGEIHGDISLGTGGSSINNYGEIYGTISAGAGSDVVKNNGSILGYVDLGEGSGYVYNYGEISDGVYGGDDAELTVNNFGTIESVTFGDGGGRLSNKGVISDRVFGNTGSDTVDNSNGKIILYSDLGAGKDYYYGGDGHDWSIGGDGEDLISTANGEDDLNGGNDADNLYAGSGNDRAYGGAGNDLLYGGTGNDFLYAESGNDTLYADSGNDSLTGGDGRDILYGGLGRDTFSFFAVTQSLPSAADTIGDFKRGQDKIDLQYAFDGVFKFMGKAAFADNGVESIRYTIVGNTARVLIDSNGDGVTDMRINLSKIAVLSASDFFL